MPIDIGPRLHLARPQTHMAGTRLRRPEMGKQRSQSSTGVRERKGHEEEYHIELLEYEWPDLPPIINMKDAVTRQRVSRGISYILPVDKGRNSIDNKFRTDLRAMFQEPYSTEKSGYDDDRVTRSAKVHFLTNAVDTTWTQKQVEQIPINLNSESEKSRNLYVHSAPSGGRSKVGLSAEKMKTRSSLFLPIKATVHPEAAQLRKEVEKIIQSVQEDNDEYVSDKENSSSYDSTESIETLEAEKVDNVNHQQSVMTEAHVHGRRSITQKSVGGDSHHSKSAASKLKLTAAKFSSYEQLKNTPTPKPTIPDKLRSHYLTPERNQEIWEWLHYGERITDFQYFLSICG